VADVGGAGVRLDVRDRRHLVGDRGELGQRLGRDELPAVLELQVRDDGEQVGVAGAFAVAVDGALDVHGAGVHRGDGVGDRAARVVVAVDAEVDADLTRGVHDLTHPAGQHAAVGVAEHDGGRPRVGRGLDDLEGVVGVGAVAVEEVLGVEEDAASLAGQEPDGVGDHLEVLLEGGLEGPVDVLVVALGDEGDGGGLGVQEGAGEGVLGRLPADPPGGAERDQLGVAEAQFAVGGRAEEGRVVGVGARPAALDEGDAEVVQGAGDAQLVVDRQAEALLLGAVAQGRVVHVEDVGCDGQLGHADLTDSTAGSTRLPAVPLCGRVS